MATISILKLSQLEGQKRIDAECYQPEYIKAENKVRTKHHTKLKNIITVLTDYHANGSYELLRKNVELLDNPDYALMIRTVDFERDDFENDVKYISKHAYVFLKKTQLYGKEIIINKIGKPGSVYIVPPLNKKISLGMNQFMIRPIENINAGYLYVYMICLYGSSLLKQKVTGAVPLSIDKNSVRSVTIPILEESFQNKIDHILNQHFTFKSNSKYLYSQAESLLLKELGFKDFKPKYDLSYTANLSDALGVHRVDAEYFQPAYANLIRKMKGRIVLKPLRKFILSIQKGIEVGSDNYEEEGKPFIRVSNLSINGFTGRDQKYISEGLYQQLKTTYEPKEGDFLLTKDATPGIAYIVKEPVEGIISSGILKLKINDNEIDKEYLVLCINSLVGKMQIERDSGGSVIIHWKLEQIKRLEIPILPSQTQQKIALLVQQSHKARKKAKELLEIAKRAVEIAIEKNEKEALDYISKSENK